MKLNDVDLRDICTAPTVPQRNGDGEELDNEDTIFFADEGAALKKIRFFELARNVLETYKPTWDSGAHQSIKEAVQQIKSADISDSTVDFDVAEEREHLLRGETLKVLFGKISKWFHDLKDSAFLPTKNNVTTTEPGIGVLDAHQGKVLQDQIDRVDKLFDYDVTDALTIEDSGSYVLDAAAGHELLDLISTARSALLELESELHVLRQKGIANNLSTTTSGTKLLDAYQGYKLRARFDYAYIKSTTRYTHPYPISQANQYSLVVSTTVETNYNDSLYFEPVTLRISGYEVNCIKFKKSGKYIMISQCLYTKNNSVSENATYEITLGQIINNEETSNRQSGGANGIGKGGTDTNSIAFMQGIHENDIYAMYVKRSDTINAELYMGKVLIIPTFFTDV